METRIGKYLRREATSGLRRMTVIILGVAVFVAGKWAYETYIHPPAFDACVGNINLQLTGKMNRAKRRGDYQSSLAAKVGGAFEVRFIDGKKYSVGNTVITDITVALLSPQSPDPNDPKSQHIMRCVFNASGHIVAMDEVRK